MVQVEERMRSTQQINVRVSHLRREVTAKSNVITVQNRKTETLMQTILQTPPSFTRNEWKEDPKQVHRSSEQVYAINDHLHAINTLTKPWYHGYLTVTEAKVLITKYSNQKGTHD